MPVKEIAAVFKICSLYIYIVLSSNVDSREIWHFSALFFKICLRWGYLLENHGIYSSYVPAISGCKWSGWSSFPCQTSNLVHLWVTVTSDRANSVQFQWLKQEMFCFCLCVLEDFHVPQSNTIKYWNTRFWFHNWCFTFSHRHQKSADLLSSYDLLCRQNINVRSLQVLNKLNCDFEMLVFCFVFF